MIDLLSQEAVTSQLLSEMRGRENKKTLNQIVQRYRDYGYPMTRAKFQQIIKPALIDEGTPIGTDGQGMFVAVSGEDLQHIKDWYERRMASEKSMLTKIEKAFQYV